MTDEELIRMHEGYSARPYRDSVGKLTIGFGRNLDDVGISISEANTLFKHDVDDARRVIRSYPWVHQLSDARRAALVDMAYNLGQGKFHGFKHMRAALERGDWDAAADEMLDSKWARQVGERAARLATIMITGKMPAP